MQKKEPVSQSILIQSNKVYIKINPHSGSYLASHHHFQILDDNTFLDKSPQSNNKPLSQKLLSFAIVFSHKVTTSMLINSMNIILNAFNGIDQFLIIKGSHPLKNSSLIGSCEKQSILIQLFEQFLNQSQSSYQIQSKIIISAFANQGQKNRFIDLIIGSRFSYSTKKNMDNYKTFYEKQIIDMRQFLICLKIILTRFQQCCNQKDNLIFKINLQYFDEFSSQFKKSTFYLFYTEQNSQNFIEIIKKIQILQKQEIGYGNDYGDILNVLQKSLKNSQIKIIHQIQNSNESFRQNKQILSYLSKIHVNSSKKLNKRQRIKKIQKNTLSDQTDKIFQNIQEHNKKYTYLKSIISDKKNNLNSLSYKDSKILSLVQQSFQKFVQQNTLKLLTYFQLIKNDINQRQNSYLNVRFPVSLQIKDVNIKNFYISKLYGLSQKYKMPNCLGKYQKMKSVKNQIILSLQALKKFILDQKSCQNLQKIFDKAAFILDSSCKFLTFILSLDVNKIHLYNVNLQKYKPQLIFQNQLLTKFEYTVKVAKQSKTKTQQLSIRKIKTKNHVLGQSNSFTNFNIYKVNKIIGHNIKREKQKDKIKENFSSVLDIKQNSSQISLPKILVLKKYK